MTVLAPTVDLVVTRFTRPLDLSPVDDSAELDPEDMRCVDVLVRTVAVMHHPDRWRVTWNVLRGDQVIRCECLPGEVADVVADVMFGPDLIEGAVR